jgi:hypothetical protein
MRIEDSPGWKALLKIKEYYFAGRKLILNKGGLVRFWIDPWLDDVPLCKSYPGLYDICEGQESTFEKVVGNGMIVPFRPRMPPVMLNQWEYIKGCAPCILSGGVTWSLLANGKFSTKSFSSRKKKLVRCS